MEKNKTFYDIVEKSGLSIATVSRYFNNPDIVAEKSKKKIEKAIDEVGYMQNKFAKTLATGRSEIIGIIVPNLEMDFYSSLLTALLDYSQSLGYKCMVFNSNTNYELELEHIKNLKSYQVIGIINYSHAISSAELKALNPNTVVIERDYQNLKSVSSDNAKGGRLAFEHLQEIGCDVYININTADNGTAVFDRTSKFLDMCEQNKVTYEFMCVDYNQDYDHNAAILKDCLKQLLTKYPNKKIGVFMSNDYYASILKAIIKRSNIKIPDQIALIGFDNSPVSYQTSTPITTIKQDIPKIAMEAIDLLVTDEVKHSLIDVELIVRGTTK